MTIGVVPGGLLDYRINAVENAKMPSFRIHEFPGFRVHRNFGQFPIAKRREN